MDWVQCNNCGTKPNQIKMYLTACGHIFCHNCVEKAKESQCYLCKKPLKVDEINKSLRPDLMELFKDPKQVANDLINELKQVVTFQAKQREIYMKIKNAETKKETEKYNEARNRQMKMSQEIEKRKKAFAVDNARLKTAKDTKKQLMAAWNGLRNENSRNSAALTTRHSHTRTEPPTSKIARMQPPPGTNHKSSHDFPLNLLDQSTSKIVTSTPIINVDCRRRDYMNRMFGAGLEHPSPILRH